LRNQSTGGQYDENGNFNGISTNPNVYQSIIESKLIYDELAQNSNKTIDIGDLKMSGSNPVCQVNYSFNRVKRNRTSAKFKTPRHFFYNSSKNNSESKLRQNNPFTLDDPSRNYQNIPKTYVLKYNVTPAPLNYSIEAL